MYNTDTIPVSPLIEVFLYIASLPFPHLIEPLICHFSVGTSLLPTLMYVLKTI
jgi:hypothetical protein